ncbi:MAG: M48 family metallopeptidase [Chloroflexi bacterium]|nr:M48 family metallopeptidase [Chloroflexota bacterium]
MGKDRDDQEPRIDLDRQKKARSYARKRRIVFFLDTAMVYVYAGALLASGLSLGLRETVARLSGNQIVIVALYAAVFYLGYVALTYPIAVLGGYVLPRQHSLSTQTFGEWSVDWAKGLAISAFIGLLAVETAYYLMGAIPGLWWLVMGILALLFTVVLTNLAPIALVPLFFKMAVLSDESLVRRLVRLASNAKVKVRGVYRMNLSSKTTAANAALMGLGNTRRIVLGDTMLDRYTDEEIETVFAHELGHHVHADIPRSILVQSALMLAGLYVASLVLDSLALRSGFESVADIATLPLLALALGVVGLLAMPIGNAFSRWQERRADLYALEATGNPRAFRNAMVRIANQNLAELDPGALIEFLLYDHPSIRKRIMLAEEFERGR